MRYYLVAAALLSLAACTTARDRVARQAYHDPFGSEPLRGAVVAPAPDAAHLSPAAKAKLAAKHRRGMLPAADSDGGTRLIEPDGLATAQPLPWVARPVQALGELFGRRKASPQPDMDVPQLPRKCKGCMLVFGNATVAGKKGQVAAGDNATASIIEKKAGPSIVGSDSSTQNALLGAGNLAAVRGDGNTLPQTATTQQAADWRAALAKPAGYALATVGTVLVVGGLLYGFILWRKKKAATTLV